MARRRDRAARGGPAARRRSALRIVGFWLLFAVAGIGGIKLVDRIVTASSERIAGGRADVAGLPGHWGDGRTEIEIRGQSGRLAMFLIRDETGAPAGRDPFTLNPRRSGLFATDPVFASDGDPLVQVRLVGDRLMLSASGMRGGLPVSAALARIRG